MKIRHKMMLLPLLALLVLPMFLAGPDGKPMMSTSDWLPEGETTRGLKNKMVRAWNTMSGKVQSGTGLDVSIDTPKVYKWQDEHGRWQFSNEPPASVVANVSVQDMPQLGNVMQPVKPRERAEAANAGGPGFKLAFPTSIPVRDIPKLVDDAKSLQKTADLRKTALDNI